MAEEKRPRWESEMWTTVQPNAKICETCMFRFYEVDGKKVDEPLASIASICEIYEYPDSKPYEVLFDGADCENYEKDE